VREEFVDDSFADPEEAAAESALDTVEFGDISEVTPEEFAALRQVLSDGTRSLTDEEHLQMQKHLFVNCCAAGVIQEDKEQAWANALHKQSLSPQFWNLVAERKGVKHSLLTAAVTVYAHQKSLADKHLVVSGVLGVCGLASSVENGATVPKDSVDRALRYMLDHEEHVDLLFGLKASARKQKDTAWARARISCILKEWCGSTLERVRQGKRGKSSICWVVRAALAAVGQVIGVNQPALPFTAVTITA
jgi:hypothetical protein